jgi:RNA polymerase sigma factor (sigma-70 family)
VLRHSTDADDAFQATFLVLMRKAGDLRSPDKLAGWLHQVALRTAKKLRGEQIRRSGREVELFDVPAGESPADFLWRELRPIFDEELSRLPERLRLPAVLCFLEGQSKRDAARTLGWPEGTVSGRLQRAREWLRKRLTARGLALSNGALAIALFESAGSAAVPATLIESTIHQVTMGPAASAGARALAEGVMQSMLFTKVKAVAAAVLVCGAFGTGGGLMLAPGTGEGQVIASQPAKDAPPKPPVSKARSDNELLILRAELDTLKDRQAYGEKMVQKGYMAETQLAATRAKIAHVEFKIRQLEAPKLPDPRRAVVEDSIKQLERALQLAEDGLKKGLTAETEVIAARLRLNEYKLKLLELPEHAPAAEKRPAESDASRQSQINQREIELARAKDLVKAKAIPSEDLRRMRFDLEQLKAEAAEAQGDYAAALKHHEAAVGELEAQRTAIKALVDRRVASQSELRLVDVGLAEAKIQALEAGIRKHLADVVAVREHELQEAKVLFDSKSISVEVLQKFERALEQAKSRLAARR